MIWYDMRSYLSGRNSWDNLRKTSISTKNLLRILGFKQLNDFYFWSIILLSALLAVLFIVEVFIKFYLEVL